MASLVRPASVADASAIGAVQSRSWRLAYADLLPADTLAALDAGALAEPWFRAVADPPSPRHRVLVAVADDVVVGFVASAGIEISALVVDPFHQRQGHGSRLLAACVDLLREDGARRIQTWAPQRDDVLVGFLGSAGIEPDGARRTYQGPDGAQVTELRLAASLYGDHDDGDHDDGGLGADDHGGASHDTGGPAPRRSAT